jgi:thiosulfate reductase cytochrome b subunit
MKNIETGTGICDEKNGFAGPGPIYPLTLQTFFSFPAEFLLHGTLFSHTSRICHIAQIWAYWSPCLLYFNIGLNEVRNAS